jgi:hypothetical protein
MTDIDWDRFEQDIRAVRVRAALRRGRLLRAALIRWFDR